MKTHRHPLVRIIARWIAAIAGVAALTSPAAESTGVITGRILNPATGEYVRNATVEIKETGQRTVSGEGGEYRLLAVPAGTATVSVAYTGYRAEPAAVTVAPGGTTTRDFDLVSAVGQGDSLVIKVADGGFPARVDAPGQRRARAKATAPKRNGTSGGSEGVQPVLFP